MQVIHGDKLDTLCETHKELMRTLWDPYSTGDVLQNAVLFRDNNLLRSLLIHGFSCNDELLSYALEHNVGLDVVRIISCFGAPMRSYNPFVNVAAEADDTCLVRLLGSMGASLNSKDAQGYYAHKSLELNEAIHAATLRASSVNSYQPGRPPRDVRSFSLKRSLGANLPLEENSHWPVGMRERVRGLLDDSVRLDNEDMMARECPAYTKDGEKKSPNMITGRMIGHGLSFDDVALALPMSVEGPETDPRVRQWLRYVGEFFGPKNVYLMTTEYHEPDKHSYYIDGKDEFDFPVKANGEWVVDGVAYPKILLPSFERESPRYMEANKWGPLWNKMKRFWVYTGEPGNVFAERKWVVKIDPDSLMLLPYFMPVFSCVNESRPLFYGINLYSSGGSAIIGGGCIASTKKAREVAAREVLDKQRKYHSQPLAEDVYISSLVHKEVYITYTESLASFTPPDDWWEKRHGVNATDVCVIFHHMDAITLPSALALGYSLL